MGTLIEVVGADRGAFGTVYRSAAGQAVPQVWAFYELWGWPVSIGGTVGHPAFADTLKVISACLDGPKTDCTLCVEVRVDHMA